MTNLLKSFVLLKDYPELQREIAKKANELGKEIVQEKNGYAIRNKAE